MKMLTTALLCAGNCVALCALLFVSCAAKDAGLAAGNQKLGGAEPIAALDTSNAQVSSAELRRYCALAMEEALNTQDHTQQGYAGNLRLSYAALDYLMTRALKAEDYSFVASSLTAFVAREDSGVGEKDPYRAYWLLMAAYAYLKQGYEPFAEYYFDRILRTEDDLVVKGHSATQFPAQSIHYLCLKNLIAISRTPRNRARYFSDLINRFASHPWRGELGALPQRQPKQSVDIQIAELYYRLALEYEKDSEWEKAIAAFRQFLDCPDASTIQIAGESNAFDRAHQAVDLYNSKRNWTYPSLSELEAAVERAIANYDWRALDQMHTKVNFTAPGEAAAPDEGETQNFSFRSYMRGQPIKVQGKAALSPDGQNAYLVTTGWSQYVPVWTLYFRKVNFPLDPEINGNWEWAGIQIGSL